MTADDCRQWRERLGALVLGRLSDEERTATEAHLEGCEACRSEANSLAAIAGLLPLVDPANVVGPAPAPPPELGNRIASQIARESRESVRRRRVRFGFGLAGAAATAAAVVIAIVVLASPGGGGQAGNQHVSFHALPPGVSINANLKPRPWGTEVRMRVEGIRSGTLCRVFLRRTGGPDLLAGSFRYRYGSQHLEAVLTSALDASDATAIEVKAGNRTFVEPLPRAVGARETSFHEPTDQEESL